VADLANRTSARLNASNEGAKGDERGLGARLLDEHEVDEWVERPVECFASGMA